MIQKISRKYRRDGLIGLVTAVIFRALIQIRLAVWKVFLLTIRTPARRYISPVSTFLTALSAKTPRFRIDRNDGRWLIDSHSNSHKFFFPGFPKSYQRFKTEILRHALDTDTELRGGLARYVESGFVEISPGDIVFDVGGFVGSFALSAADPADHVYTFEADPDNCACLRRNTADTENVTVLQNAVWNEQSELRLAKQTNQSDSSLINTESKVGQIRVEANTLANFAEELDVPVVDFLKCDVEGAEPEVIAGINGLRVRKVAVDCSERRSDTTTETIAERLVSQGYDVRTVNHMVYARLPESEEN